MTQSQERDQSQQDNEKLGLQNEQLIKQQIKNFEKQLENKYIPHLNLFNKKILNQKVQCYSQFKLYPSKYYECLKNVDQDIQLNINNFQSKLAICDESYQKCQETCKISFQKHENTFINCSQKCFKEYSDEALKIYKSHFQNLLQDQSEFKKLKF